MSEIPIAATGTGTPSFEKQSLEALQAIGKALGQIALYKVGHPAVAATLTSARENLEAVLSLIPNGEMIVSFDQHKIIANGRQIGVGSQLPNAILNCYNRFKLTSLTFRSGLTHQELAAFCELSGLRADASAAADPRGFLTQRGVTHLTLNEAVYLKADGESGPEVGGGGSGGSSAGSGGSSDDGHGVGSGADAQHDVGGGASENDEMRGINDAIQSGSMERTLRALVEKSTPNPALRDSVVKQVMKLLENDMARRVDEVTRPLRREIQTIENEAVRSTSVIQNMVDGVVVVDDEGKILMMNPAAEQIYGETLDKSAGKPITEKSSNQFVVTLAADLQTPDDRDIDKSVKITGDDDTKKTLRSSSAVVQTEEGKVVGVVTSLPDAAKHRELQKIQRDFVSHVTHELRAPLSSIRAALEIVQSEYGMNMQSEEARMIGTALSNSDRLAEMINGILDFSKIESGQMTVHTKPTAPLSIVKQAVESLQPWAQKKQLELKFGVPDGMPMVDADASRTVQILVNLISNAIKFTPPKGRIAVVANRRVEDSGNFIEFAVWDTGPGIPKADQERIFEKFAQIASGEAHVGGTGLGLSIAKALVHVQKGRMWLESELGEGSRFYFTLPVHTAQSVEAAAIRSKPVVVERPWWKKLFGIQ